MIEIKPQGEFPLLKLYSDIFPINDMTIFAFDNTIYTNYQLTADLYVHECTHIAQQNKIGLQEWLYDFLYEPERRLQIELEAYRKQLASIKDGNHRLKVRIQSAKTISSPLYGNIISYDEAYNILK